ncbi:MAG: M50 family metallopeptidase [Clostridia bacterium]|nr:M50 family metallopeptidase [Clostridia bacterium]
MALILSAVTFAGVMKWIGYIIVALLCLMFMIVVHEFGHYVVGKLLGFKVDEFSIGFGPAIFQYTSKKTDEKFSLRCIPLGGYCGFHGETDDTTEPTEEDFNYHKPWKRILVFIAGAGFNLLSAVILCTIFFTAYGDMMPKVTEVYQFVDVNIEQKLMVGDVIIEVDGESIYSTAVMNDVAKKLSKFEDKVNLTIVRNGEKMVVEVRRSDYYGRDEQGYDAIVKGLGIGIGEYVEYRFGFVEALGRSFVFIFKLVGTIFTTIGGIITGVLGVGESMGGTITAIQTIAQISQIGFRGVLFAVCALSANIAIMNLLPIPALDGSHVVFTTIEWIRKKPLNRKVENIIHTVGLICLFILAIVLDVVHFIS